MMTSNDFYEPRGRRFQRRRIALIVVPIAVLATVGLGYYFLTHGYESRRVQFSGLVSSEGWGGNISGGKVYARQGQKIVVDYEVTALSRGRFRVFIMRTKGLGGFEILADRDTDHEGTGRLELVVPESGFYKVDCDGSPDANGYDVTYEARWRVE